MKWISFLLSHDKFYNRFRGCFMSTPQARIPMMLLKHTSYYITYDDAGNMVFVQFRAEVGYDSFFKVPIARWIWPNGDIVEVSVTPFTGVLKYTAPLPFNIEYRQGAWYADLRVRP